MIRKYCIYKLITQSGLLLWSPLVFVSVVTIAFTNNYKILLDTEKKFHQTNYIFTKNDFLLLINTKKFNTISLVNNKNTDIYNFPFNLYTQKKHNISIPEKNNLKNSSATTYPQLDNNKKRVQDRFHEIIVKASNKYKVDSAMIKAIILAESSYNPKAVSSKGAQGLMQLMPRTAKYLGVKDSFNPKHNIDGGVKYFRRLLDRFDNNYDLALAAYNAGSKKVRKYKGIPPYKETKQYIKKVNSYYKYFKLST